MNKKILLFGILSVLAVSLVVAVVVWTHNVRVDGVDATVSEAFESTTLDLDFSGVAGNTIGKEIAINNLASVPITVNLVWAESSNFVDLDLDGVDDENVIYTAIFPETLEVQPGDNFIPVVLQYNRASPIGKVSGTLTLTRGTA